MTRRLAAIGIVGMLATAGKPRSRLVTSAAAAIAATGTGLLVWFDLGPALAFNDDWVYAWSVRQLLHGHGLRTFPEQSAAALVQVAWASVALFGQADQRLLRLSALPFIALACWSAWRLALRVGAGPEWAAIAGVALLGTPVYMGVATSFMTEPFYIGLLLLGAWSACLWLEGKGGPTLLFAATILATLERQVGVGIAVALLLTGILSRGRNGRIGVPLALLAVTCATTLVPGLLGAGTANQGIRMAEFLRPDPEVALRAVAYMPVVLGLLLTPFAAGIALSRRAPGRNIVGIALAGVGTLTALVLFVLYFNILPGDVFTPLGLNPVHLAGLKPHLFPAPLFAGIEIVALVTSLVVLAIRGAAWMPHNLPPGAVFLLLLSLSQFVPALVTGQLDRYFLPVAAPLLPVAALIAGRSGSRAALGWAIGSLALGVSVYALGQQDYESWQVARDQAARQAYATSDPGVVDAGYEAYSVYYVLPYFERFGREPAPIGQRSRLPTLSGPSQPRYRVEFAAPSDRRPGFNYGSSAPGKVIIVPAE